MADITTASLFTYQSFRDLVVQPLFQTSRVLPYVQLLQTDSTHVTFPTVSGGAASWRNELEDLGDAGILADEVTVTPAKLAVAQVASSEAVDDAGAAAILGTAMAAAAAQAIDLAFFRGGAKAPAGLTTAGLALGVVAVAPGLDSITDAVNAVEAAGATPTVIWVSPSTWGTLSKIKTGTGSNMPALVPSTTPGAAPTRTISGIPVVVTAAVPDDQAVVADGNKIVAVMRKDGAVEVDRSVKFLSDAVAVRLIMRLSFGFPYPGAVVRVSA